MARKELPQRDLQLKGGLTAKFVYEDEWARNVYEIDWNEKIVEIVDVDGILYSMTREGEPNGPLRVELQPTE